jgi:hypothetical protein
MTGTLKFMAIEVVRMAFRDNQRNLEHTYRHDLESFFYVFLSMCVHYGRPAGRGPKEDPFRRWYVGSHEDMVGAKRGDMERGGFRTDLLSKFSPGFECAKELANVHPGVAGHPASRDANVLFSKYLTIRLFPAVHIGKLFLCMLPRAISVRSNTKPPVLSLPFRCQKCSPVHPKSSPHYAE